MAKFSRRKFLKLTAAATAEIVGVVGYAHGIEPVWIQVREVPLVLPNLDPEFNGYRVAQISDIHIDTSHGFDFLEKVVRKINEQQPDVIAITGDFITSTVSPYDDQLVRALSKLQPAEATVAVHGNHDHWIDGTGDVVTRVMKESGIVNINNAVHTVRRGSAQFHFAGVDDIWEEKQDLDKVLDALPQQGAAMLLAHEPDYADISAAAGRFDLQISGHTHGSQADWMGLEKKLLYPMLPPWGRKYVVDLYQVGQMWQYTNRGVGGILDARMNCRPEITLFTLHSDA